MLSHDEKETMLMVGALTRSTFEQAQETTPDDQGPPVLQVQLLATFALRVAGKAIPSTLWSGSSRARSLCQYLAYRAGVPLDRDGLIERLWPDLEPDISQSTLHKAVHFLRQRLSYVTGLDGRELLDFRAGCYTFQAGHLQVDAAAFKRAIFEAKWCERLGDTDGRLHHLVRAIGLYRGDLLEDDYTGEWVIPERERLRHDLCAALTEAACLCRAAGARDLASTYYQRLVAVDPCAEDGYQALIEMALDAGRRGEAIRLYQRCKEALHRELSLAPGVRIRQLVASV
jgi:DNA-binding SARP family transcriptional activator